MPRKQPLSTNTKKPRASKPKVKTGCLTCKIRHVKCDESKPHCTRCLSTGRVCDGYSPPRLLTHIITHSPSHTITHFPTPLPSPAITNAPTPLLPGTPSEQDSFHTFRTLTTAHLGGLFTSPFWSRHVLQASLHEPSIFHAAVALGALHSNSIHTRTWGDGDGDGEFAVRQYVKAIRGLTRPGGERRVDVTLIACLLFTIFESLRGYHAAALTHLDNGVNLLLELQSQSHSDSHSHSHSPSHANKQRPAYPSLPYTPLPALRELVMRLDTQATQLLPTRRTRLRPFSAPCTDCAFTSLEEARAKGDELWNYSLYTLQPSASSASSSPPSCSSANNDDSCLSPRGQAHRHTSRIYLADLQARYSTALSTYLATHPPLTPRERQAGMLLKLYDAVATLSLSTASLSPSQEVWSAYTPDFAAILSLSKSILEMEDALGDDETGISGGRGGRVGMDTGVLGPLYLVALRCRDLVVRSEAVRLLTGAEGRREGLWDSNLLTRVAEGVVGREGAGVGMVEDVDLVFDPEEGCKACVRFLMDGRSCGDAGGGEGIGTGREGVGVS
ncbi:hypothetical protein V499_09323 [Pseudogymnoascus sp. VKM F-103]|nr:hypothetical protein V499_09323 [Pseudogymnoascus sp. VKM F-103]